MSGSSFPAVPERLPGSYSKPRLEKLACALENRDVIVGEIAEPRGDGADPATAAAREDPPPLRGRLDEHRTAITLVGAPSNEALLLEAGDDPGHRGRSDGLGLRQFAKREGAAEDDDGEGGKAGRADS